METIQERTTRILSRFSIFDLREFTPDDLETATAKLLAAPVAIVEQGIADNLIEWFIVESGANLYEVRKFVTFGYCSCESFFYGRMCRHLAATMPPVCASCKKPTSAHGAICSACEMRKSPYLKRGTGAVPTTIGNLRI